MSERDPRVDPRAGDVLIGKNGGRMETRLVTEIWRRSVFAKRGRTASNLYHIDRWREWAKGAEVITRADDAALAAVLRPVVEGKVGG